MSEYNPFDIAPPLPQAREEKPAEKPVAPKEVPGQVRYAAPPPAPPGRAPLAGQQAAQAGSRMPPQQYGGDPRPHGTPSTAVEPTPNPNVRYDLAGNPLPPQLPPAAGQSAPDMNAGVGVVRYDLAGNPLPMQPSAAPPPPQGPGGPYGYSPGPGQASAPEPYSAPQNAFRPSAPTRIVPSGMEEAMTAGANWMIGIVLLTLASIWINKLTYPFYMMPFISYAAVSGVIDIPWIFGHALGYNVAGVLASLALMPLAFLAVLGFKRQSWVFMIAMIVYGIDIPVTILTWILNFSLWGIIIGTAWHSFVFQRMFAAFTAAREINATMAGQRH